MSNNDSFKVGIDFQSVLQAISKQIYETPLAFIRENVQNAVDAIRIQAYRDGNEPSDSSYNVDIIVNEKEIRVTDNGVGMTRVQLRDFFWTIGASGKRTDEAKQAGCVGMFGIGGFANFGVCSGLTVISKAELEVGTITSLTQEDIESSGTGIPSVHVAESTEADPRGTIVIGQLREEPNIDDLKTYLEDFVRFIPMRITFNGVRMGQKVFSSIKDKPNMTMIRDTSTWTFGTMKLSLRMFEDKGKTIFAELSELTYMGNQYAIKGFLRFDIGQIDVFKGGFKLCATHIGTVLGVNGRIDCNLFTPTAGRDSLDSVSSSILREIVSIGEAAAAREILRSGDRIAQNTRVFKYIVNRGKYDDLDNVKVQLVDGTETTLDELKTKSGNGVQVYFGLANKESLSQVMQARGHIVVKLSSEQNRQTCERRYLHVYCGAKQLDDVVECVEIYQNLTRFELVFLSKLEENISRSYEIKAFKLVAGKLTEDIPVYIQDEPDKLLEIFVDVRHSEIIKLEVLGFSQLLYSVISSFCTEYLGQALKKRSPRFFGDGAMNLDMLWKKRSELWVLVQDDIGFEYRGQRQVVRSADVQTYYLGNNAPANNPNSEKRILKIIDDSGETELGGFYIRIPETAYKAYGDLIPGCTTLGVVWAGNKILYVASDAVSAAFQFEIRIDEIVLTSNNGQIRTEGAVELTRSTQELYGSLYFPIPEDLEQYLVPKGEAEIRVELHCDWIDLRTSMHWKPKE
jgi:molecular chaperone HtpG